MVHGQGTISPELDQGSLRAHVGFQGLTWPGAQ